MIIKRKFFSLISDSIEDLLIPRKQDIIELKKNKYPKFYIDYLEKVNPIICKELELDSTFAFPFAINFKHYDVYIDKIKETKDGKTYIPCITTDPDPDFLGGFALYYLGEDNKFYERKGIFFPKFIEVKDVKNDLLNEIVNSGDYWDGDDMPQNIKKIVDAIKKL